MRQSGLVLALALGGSNLGGIAQVARAQSSLMVVYPPDQHQTTADQIFFIGAAVAGQPVTINGQVIDQRSAAGYFAPSLPLQLGENHFTITQGKQTLTLTVIRLPLAASLPANGGFAEGSLAPAQDLAEQPGDRICLSVVAPTQAQITATLGNRSFTLEPQPAAVTLPANAAVLTNQTDPLTAEGPIPYQSCFTAGSPAELGHPTYHFTQGAETVTATAPGTITILAPEPLTVAEVTAAAGVARTGPSTDYSRLTPLPQGTRAVVTGRMGDWLRLDYGGWIRAAETRTFSTTVPPHSLIRGVTSRQAGDWTELRFPLQVPVPVSIEQQAQSLTLTLYNTTPQTDTIFVSRDALIDRFDWQPLPADQVRYRVQFKTPYQWGYQLHYDGTTLVLSLKHPPVLGHGDGPLSGATILIDPGHGGEETGATGPNGTPEKEVTLAVGQRLQTELEARGAKVIMTRTDDQTLGPNQRGEAIEQVRPTLALSLHYNALPDSGDALHTAGIGSFWYQPQAYDLAQFLHDYLVQTLDRPSYGVFWNNLALTRPAAAPSVLLELGFLINPDEFEWIVDADAQQQLATTLADGIQHWLIQATAPASMGQVNPSQ